MHQVPLNVKIPKDCNVQLSCNGRAHVHLTGWLMENKTSSKQSLLSNNNDEDNDNDNKTKASKSKCENEQYMEVCNTQYDDTNDEKKDKNMNSEENYDNEADNNSDDDNNDYDNKKSKKKRKNKQDIKVNNTRINDTDDDDEEKDQNKNEDEDKDENENENKDEDDDADKDKENERWTYEQLKKLLKKRKRKASFLRKCDMSPVNKKKYALVVPLRSHKTNKYMIR